MLGLIIFLIVEFLVVLFAIKTLGDIVISNHKELMSKLNELKEKK